MIQAVSTPTEPVTADYVKNYLHWNDFTSDMDAILDDYITAAREMIEKSLNASLAEKTYKMWFEWEDLIDGKIRLLYPPHTSITSFKGIDRENNETNLTVGDDYYVYKHFAYEVLVMSWHSRYEIQFESGYENLPKALKMAIVEQVGNWYEGNDEMGELSASVRQKVGAYKNEA